MYLLLLMDGALDENVSKMNVMQRIVTLHLISHAETLNLK
jgi:hypothetical protein